MTKKIIYFHGFSSAGSTGTAVTLRGYLYEDYGVQVISPDIPVMPLQALEFLNDLVKSEAPDLIIGTSMGAMYAELINGNTGYLEPITGGTENTTRVKITKA